MGASQSSAPRPMRKIEVSPDLSEYADLIIERDRLRDLREAAIQNKEYAKQKYYDNLLAENRDKIFENHGRRA